MCRGISGTSHLLVWKSSETGQNGKFNGLAMALVLIICWFFVYSEIVVMPPDLFETKYNRYHIPIAVGI